MQDNERKYNQKRANVVQNVSAKNDAKTLHLDALKNISRRAKFQCNSRLKRYIDLANIIPADFDFDWHTAKSEDGFDKALVHWTRELLTLTEVETLKLLRAQIEGIEFPIEDNFPDIENNPDPIKFSGIALIQFLKIQEIRELLRGLIRLNDSEGGQTSVLEETLKRLGRKVADVKAKIDSDGSVNFQLSEFAEALQGVNTARLRRCEECDKLFWASRKDAFSCSIKHARNRRMRLLRVNWKEKGDLYIKARKKKAKSIKENK